MVAQQQHDAEHGPEAVPRGTLRQLQQPVVLRTRGQVEASKAWAPQPTLGPTEGRGLEVLLEMGAEGCSQEARSAAPRLCHPGEGAVLSESQAPSCGEHALLLRPQRRLGSRCLHLLHSPSPIFPLFTCLAGGGC